MSEGPMSVAVPNSLAGSYKASGTFETAISPFFPTWSSDQTAGGFKITKLHVNGSRTLGCVGVTPIQARSRDV